MAVYKLIQDIEAEDKLIGPLTLKGFIYAAITALLGFINYRIFVAYSMGNYRFPLLLVFLAPMILFGVLASPLGRDQPTEVWLLSHIRFFFKPRTRIWNQSGTKISVTITAPKKVDQPLTKQITNTEVKSRLKALATTLDSRGWAVKNVAVNETSLVDYLQASANSDRLVSAKTAIGEDSADVRPADDILDPQHNTKAQHMEQLLEANDQQRKAEISKRLQQGPDSNTKSTASRPLIKPVTPQAQPAKLKELAQSGNALSVASLAKLANRPGPSMQAGGGEVVVSLH